MSMSGAAFLGLDIGTSSIKAVLIDENQNLIAESAPSLTVSRPHPLWSEQSPHDWTEGVESAVAAIRRETGSAFNHLAGVGLSGQMHGAVLLGKDDRVLRPAIL